ncbi:MAG: hypothetical protein P4L84_22325 [Isosphaeraceae bacterium]|nr:hypothetical protein [Isosphaeraceae bacterium]
MRALAIGFRMFVRALPLAIAAGCGTSQGHGIALTGEIMFNGKPISDGSISLVPIAGTSSPTTGATIKGGSFKIDRRMGPYPGKYKVEIYSFVDSEANAKDKKRLNASLFGQPPDKFSTDPALTSGRSNEIPERYNTKTELTTTIPDSPSYELRFDLTK